MSRAEVTLLRRLAAGEADALPGGLRPGFEAGRRASGGQLDARTGALVRLSALMAVDACATTLRWAVELAECSRAADDEIVGVLATVAPLIGHAGVNCEAPRLAIALGYDIEAPRAASGSGGHAPTQRAGATCRAGLPRRRA